MTRNSTRAYCMQPLRFLGIVFTAILFMSACSEQPSESSNQPSSYNTMRKSDVVYGVENKMNPFESVGLRHNDLVHAVICAAQPWDTLNAGDLIERARLASTEWAQQNLEVAADQLLHHINTAFALGIDSTARQRLTAYESEILTSREQNYIRSIGEVLCTEGTFADIECALLDLEKDILAETWPAGDSTEIAARIGISIAKHSFAYWKRMMIEVHGLENGQAFALTKGATDAIIATTKTEIITAADVFAGVAAAENLQGAGFKVQIGAAIITGGLVSIIVAIIVYINEIVEFLGSLLPWNW